MTGLGNGFQLRLGKMRTQQRQFLFFHITAEPAAHKQHGAGIGKFGGQGAGDFYVVADQNVQIEFPRQGVWGGAAHVLEQKLPHAGVGNASGQNGIHVVAGAALRKVHRAQGVKNFLVVRRIGLGGHVYRHQRPNALRVGTSPPLRYFSAHGVAQPNGRQKVGAVLVRQNVGGQRRVGVFCVPRALPVVSEVQGVHHPIVGPPSGQRSPIVAHAKEPVEHQEVGLVGMQGVCTVHGGVQLNHEGRVCRAGRRFPGPSTGRLRSGRGQC